VTYRHGLVVGKFYPPHAGHHHLINVAAAGCTRVTVVVAPSRRESIPLDARLSWLREIHADSTHVRFVGVYDDHPIDYASPGLWDAHCTVFRSVAAGPVDAVFSSEAYGDELARRFEAVHVPVDPGRATVPVSGTAIRADPIAHWHHLAAPVRAWFTRRVVAVGAESTGTTTIAASLAGHYRTRGGVWADTAWVPEYGRELTARKVAQSGGTVFDLVWTRDDFAEVVAAQNAAEDAAARTGSPVLFCDTDATATAVWEHRYLGSASAEVLAAARPADLYLLTDHEGVPFYDDGLRDGEHLRAWMTDQFRKRLAQLGVPVVGLRGSPNVRLGLAVAACDALLNKGWPLAEPMRAPPCSPGQDR
jgi:HTH-type transcriptional regulator, transcriptional repressor of NAD biosynthesis genes